MAQNTTPSHELPVRAAAALLEAAAVTLTDAGLPAPRHRGLGSWWPLCSHSFMVVTELPYLPSPFEDTDRAGGATVATVHYTTLELAVGRCRPALTDACTWDSYMGGPVACDEDVPTPPDDAACDLSDDCGAYSTASGAWAAASVDRHALIRGLRKRWATELDACGISGACKAMDLTAAEPFEEGRFIGTRLAWTLQLA